MTVSPQGELAAADFREAQALLAAQMQAAAGEIVKAGGIIGHIKFILRAGNEAVRLSLTDAEVDITGISRKQGASGKESPAGFSAQARGNVIVFQIPEDRLLRILEETLQLAFSRPG